MSLQFQNVKKTDDHIENELQQIIYELQHRINNVSMTTIHSQLTTNIDRLINLIELCSLSSDSLIHQHVEQLKLDLKVTNTNLKFIVFFKKKKDFQFYFFLFFCLFVP